MQIIDKRWISLTTTFGDLAIGEAFQDNDGDICIKTDVGTYMYCTFDNWISSCNLGEDELIIPLKVTYTIEREDSRK